jgi:hypothetical protein
LSASELKLPKLHSWIHHIIPSIRNYGAINGFTSETYESLHKTYVKQPYRMSNKKNIETQLMQAVSINLKFFEVLNIYTVYFGGFRSI